MGTPDRPQSNSSTELVPGKSSSLLLTFTKKAQRCSAFHFKVTLILDFNLNSAPS